MNQTETQRDDTTVLNQREAFEKWFTQDYGYPPKFFAGQYAAIVQPMWVAWQAALSQPAASAGVGYYCKKHQRASREAGAECSECYREYLSPMTNMEALEKTIMQTLAKNGVYKEDNEDNVTITFNYGAIARDIMATLAAQPRSNEAGNE
jgi:hypothetical protein